MKNVFVPVILMISVYNLVTAHYLPIPQTPPYLPAHAPHHQMPSTNMPHIAASQTNKSSRQKRTHKLSYQEQHCF